MSIRIIYCILLISLGTNAAAQSLTKIEGYVLSVDDEPLENAEIVIVGGAYGTVTNERGYFKLQNIFAGEYTIRVSHVGYQTEIKQHILVNKDVPVRLTFRLKPYVGMVNEIVVTARRVADTESTSEIHITTAQIRKSSARTLGELLVQIPGITVVDEGAGSGRKRISIRGGNPNQVLVQIDGVTVNDPLTGETDLNLIPLSLIDHVIIYKGGDSAQSGSGAMAGRIEISSRQAMKNEVQVSLNAGSFHAQGIQTSLSGIISRFSVFFNFDYQRDRGNYPYTYEELDGMEISERRLNAGYTARQYFFKVGYKSGSHQVMLQANLYGSERGLPGTVFYWTPYASADVSRRLFAANYIFDSDPLDLSAQISAYHNTSEYRNQWPEDPPLIYRRVPPYHTTYVVDVYQGDLKGDWQWDRCNKSEIRILYRYDLFEDEDLLNNSTGSIRQAGNKQTALSLEHVWNFTTPVWLTHSNLKIAARYDQFRLHHDTNQRIDGYLSPKIGLYLGYDRDWLFSLQINYGRSFRSPTFADLYYQDFRVRGNAALLPEKSTDFDAGLRFRLPWVKQPEISVTYFRQQIQNLIVWELGSFATWQPTNLDAFIDGIEYEFLWSPWTDHLSLNINHINLNARDRSSRHTTHDKILTYRPANTIRLGIEFEYDFFSLMYQKRIVSARYVTAANTVSLSGYQVDDVILNFKFSAYILDLNMRLMLLNAFDTRYEIIRDAPLPGRHWRGGVEIWY